MKIAMKWISNTIEVLLRSDAIRATKYVSSKEVIRVVRKTYKYNGRKINKGQNVEIILTFGRPNYLERDFIKKCLKAKEPFPVKKVQLKFPPLKKKIISNKKRK